MAGTNNFLVFNEANNPTFTMSDADYYADLYRLNGLIPMIADPIAHNKMYRQWSIMISAIAGLIASMNYNASDADLVTLQANLKSAIEDVAEAKVDSRITTLENWKSSITATPAELNILDGVTASTSELNILNGLTVSTAELNTLDGITASTAELNILDGVTVTSTELNYLDGAKSNIQQQINNLSISALFPLWVASREYSVGDVVKTLSSSFWVYLECVVTGTSDTTEPTFTNVGELVTDGTVKWLVLDLRDSAPVGTFKTDIVQRLGWLKANGATLNRADYPRLWAWAVDNNLTTNDQTNNPGLFGVGDEVDTFELPDYEDYFVRYSYVRNVGSKQNSQMAEHNHSCGNQDTSHNHTFKYSQYTVQSGSNYTLNVIGGSLTYSTSNQSASHKHNIGNTGSGDNTYPDNITMQMYIKY